MNPLKVGNVIGVRGDGLEVLLTTRNLSIEHEARTYRVGQLGTYVTIPMDARTVVGFVTAIGRQEVASADVEPEMILSVQLIGTIEAGRFVRGVNEYPTVGDDVWVAVHGDFETIFGSFDQLLAGPRTDDGSYPRSFAVGRFAMNTDFEVRVLGKEFFSKHAAILGNSGSGKSCTTAKILQEIMQLPEAQVVLFDLHGEYAAAFSDPDGEPDPNVICVGERDLVMPYWLLKYEEMDALFVDRSNPLYVSNQISFLKRAIIELKADAAEELDLAREFTVDTPIYYAMERLKVYADNLNEARFLLNSDQLAFTQLSLRSLPPQEQRELLRTQRCQFNDGSPEGEVPHPLYHAKLFGLINLLETRLNDRRYDFLLRPVQHGRRSRFFKDIFRQAKSAGALSVVMGHLLKLLTGRLGERRANLTIVDLSGVPADVVDITVAVLTRLLFDFNFWSPAEQRHPMLLVYEEAHQYVPRVDSQRSFARLAVERLAKEGRKYGVGEMIISQRPAELSETVLSQCNNFVVMRMTNPEDQEYVTKLVSEQFAGLMDMLPVLRPGEAFFVGDSVLMPLRTLVDLPRRQPRSGDVDFFRHWYCGTADADTDGILRHWWRQEHQLLNTVNGGARDADEEEEDQDEEMSYTARSTTTHNAWSR